MHRLVQSLLVDLSKGPGEAGEGEHSRHLWNCAYLYFILLFQFSLFIYFERERERAHEQGGGTERKGERESQAGYVLKHGVQRGVRSHKL